MCASDRLSPPAALIERLRCPRCAQAVEAVDGGTAILCPDGHRYHFPLGYLDASVEQSTDATTEQTFASFGYEWNTFDEVRDEDTEYADVYFRVRQGPVHPLPRPPPRRPGRSGRLLRRRGRRPQPG